MYLQGKTLTGPERVRLFKLAFDASISGFSGRQSLYEYFFFGDPVRMAGALVNTYDREPVRARVREFLNRQGLKVAEMCGSRSPPLRPATAGPQRFFEVRFVTHS